MEYNKRAENVENICSLIAHVCCRWLSWATTRWTAVVPWPGWGLLSSPPSRTAPGPPAAPPLSWPGWSSGRSCPPSWGENISVRGKYFKAGNILGVAERPLPSTTVCWPASVWWRPWAQPSSWCWSSTVRRKSAGCGGEKYYSCREIFWGWKYFRCYRQCQPCRPCCPSDNCDKFSAGQRQTLSDTLYYTDRSGPTPGLTSGPWLSMSYSRLKDTAQGTQSPLYRGIYCL